MATAIFAAGCFWGVEAAFMELEGVLASEVGYSGGNTPNPGYKEVCTGRTGHAEVVRLDFDAARIGFEDLLEVFWNCHDPTTLNRQGADVGSQYRSAIFCMDDEQKELAERSKAALDASGRLERPAVTAIVPAATFWRAEDDHQDYFGKNPGAAVCHI